MEKLDKANLENWLTQCEAALFKKLTSKNSLTELTQLASELLGNPVFVHELDGRILSFSEGLDDIKESWKSEGGILFGNAHNMMEAIANGDHDLVFKSDEPIVGNYNHSPYTWLATRIMLDSVVVGQVSVVCKNRPVDEYAIEVIQLVSKAMGVAYRIYKSGYKHNDPTSSLLMDLLEDRIRDENVLAEGLKNLKFNFHQYYTVFVFEAGESKNKIASNYYVGEYIKSVLFGSKILHYSNDIIVVMPHKIDVTNLIPDDLLEYLIKLDFQIGQSAVFSELIILKRYYRQAKKSIALYNRMGLTGSICHYVRIAVFDLFSRVAGETDIKQYICPYVWKLQEYDRMNNTNLYGDLIVYLDNHCSLTKAANALFIHRNTMAYRIGKVKEILDDELTDKTLIFHLQLSIMIVKYLESAQDE